MARSVPYRREVSEICNWHQDQALNSTIYILYNTGPTGFLLKEDGEQKNFKVFLGDIHNCTCPIFKKEKDLCKHICWLLLKKFRVPRTNPLCWQLGLVEREINEILRGLHIKETTRAAIKKQNTEQSQNNAAEPNGIKQRVINEEDCCPICQDEFLSKKLPVTYCKFGCGNNVHIKCMKVWADHQKSNGETQLKCPLCREKFSTFELLDEEYRNNTLFKTEKQAIHHGLTCNSCNANPITGKCYKCMVCKDLHLCQACFNTDFHKEHNFLFREKDSMKYRKASRDHVGPLPPALAHSLFRRDITEQDYDLLLQLDQQSKANSENGFSKIPEKVIKAWPSERIREGHKLLNPGFQCRVCLRNYELGQLVRKLPTCKHKFHADCIDSWLLHSHPTCPIDGIVAWTPEQAEQARVEKERKLKADLIPKSAPEAPNLEISSIGLMINYRTNTVGNSRGSNNNNMQNGETVTIIHNRNSKPPRPRASATNQTKNNHSTGPSFEVKGQNLNNVNHVRRNSVSSESGAANFQSDSDMLRGRHTLLPKINSRKPEDLDPSKLQYDSFSIALIGTKPYQLSRVNNIETGSLNSYNNQETTPPLVYSHELENSLINRTDSFASSQNDDQIESLGQYPIIQAAARNQLMFENNSQMLRGQNNSKKLGLRIHHPKPKLNSLNGKLKNRTIESPLRLVAVPALKADDYSNAYNQYLEAYSNFIATATESDYDEQIN